MKKLICYPIITKTVGCDRLYNIVSACRPRLGDIWKDYEHNIIFHKNMSFGVTFLYNEYSHLFTYSNHDTFRDIYIAVYREKHSPEQRVLFNKYYNYNLAPIGIISTPVNMDEHIISYIKYKYNESVDTIKLKLP